MFTPLFPNNNPPFELFCIWWIHVIKKLYDSEVIYNLIAADPLLLILSVWYFLHIYYPRVQRN